MMEKEKNEGIIRTERRSRDGWEYTYILSVSLSRMTASYSLPLYSVSVELSHSTMGKTNEVLKDAFSDIGKAMEFFETAVAHLVTPIDLRYVFEDMISVKI